MQYQLVRKGIVLVAFVLPLSVLLLPLTVSATAWTAPFPLGKGSYRPTVAIDSHNAFHYTWWSTDGNIYHTVCAGQGGGNCSPAEALPPAGNGQGSFYPSIAIDPQDRPNVVFEAHDGSSYSVYWSRRDASGWSAPVALSSEPYAEVPDIAIGPLGHIHVVYQSKDLQTNTAYIYYTESRNGVVFSPPTALATHPAPHGIAVEAERGLDHFAHPDSQQLENGLLPKIAADANDRAYVTYNLPSPYGVNMLYQTGGGWSSIIPVSSGHKDQTADIAVNANGEVGIVWSEWDNFVVGLATFSRGSRTFSTLNVDPNLYQEMWPSISGDCGGIFHIAFQSKATGDGDSWDLYHLPYNPATQTFGRENIIANSAYHEQTPNIATTSVGAIIYNSSAAGGLTDASTTTLNVTCGPATPTPTATQTPPPDATPTATPLPGSVCAAGHVPNGGACVQYAGSWTTLPARRASDGNYARCDNGTVCPGGASALITLPDNVTTIKWETARSLKSGIAKVWINGQVAAVVDLCSGSTSLKPRFFTLTYPVPINPSGPRTFQVGAPGRHSSCAVQPKNYVTVDGFDLLP